MQVMPETMVLPAFLANLASVSIVEVYHNMGISEADLLPFTGPVESGASGVLKLDSSGGRHYLIGR